MLFRRIGRRRATQPREDEHRRRRVPGHRLDQGSTQDFPIQGYAVTAAWAKKYPNTLKAFTTALSQGQEIADTNRAAAANPTLEPGPYGIQKEDAAFISLPTFQVTGG